MILCHVWSMEGPAWFFWVIAIAFAASIIDHLRTREIRLSGVPKVWGHIKQAHDPGRFWLFLIGEIIVMIALFAEALGFIH